MPPKRRRKKLRSPRIEVSGFKSIRDTTGISIAPLTVLAGANSSGKSSVMQPLLLIKQTLENAYDPGPLLLDGSNARFSSAKEMIWRGSAVDSTSSGAFTVRHVDFDLEETALTFEATPHGIDLKCLEYANPREGDRERFILRPGMTEPEMWAAAPSRIRSLLQGKDDVKLALIRNRSFFEVQATLGGGDTPFPVSVTSSATMIRLATRLIHLPGLRDVPARFYPATQVGDVFPGVFQPYVASVISSWGESRDQRLAEVGRQLKALGLTWKVDAKRIDDTRVSLRVGRLPQARRGGHDMVNIADVGLGVSQTLPILVALLSAEAGQIVYLEQPEIHLHPRAQVALADILLDAAARGVKVVTETHSYLLLRAIQTAVISRGLAPGFVHLHWFSRDLEGASHCSEVELDQEGRFGDWPSDFAQVEMEVEDRYLSAVLGLD
jgi:hypothetical protein